MDAFVWKRLCLVSPAAPGLALVCRAARDGWCLARQAWAQQHGYVTLPNFVGILTAPLKDLCYASVVADLGSYSPRVQPLSGYLGRRGRIHNISGTLFPFIPMMGGKYQVFYWEKGKLVHVFYFYHNGLDVQVNLNVHTHIPGAYKRITRNKCCVSGSGLIGSSCIEFAQDWQKPTPEQPMSHYQWGPSPDTMRFQKQGNAYWKRIFPLYTQNWAPIDATELDGPLPPAELPAWLVAAGSHAVALKLYREFVKAKRK